MVTNVFCTKGARGWTDVCLGANVLIRALIFHNKQKRRGIRDGVAITDAGHNEQIRVLMILELRVDESTQ